MNGGRDNDQQKSPSTDNNKQNDVVGIVERESRLFLELAIPTALLNLSFTLSPFLTASYVGLKFGATYLSAFTLGNLTANLFTFSLLAGLFSAADTLSPQAFGQGDYKEVGLIAMRGIFASAILFVPINVGLVIFLEDALVWVGQDAEAALYAAKWYRIFVGALPFFVLYDAVWKFLSAQHVMRPLIIVSMSSCLVVLPLALQVFTELFGFLGSAVAFVTFQACQAILLLLYLWWKKPHHTESWPGLGCWREALQYKPMMEYLYLGAGGMFAQSEWIYWEAMGLIVGKLGVLPLSVHTIPTQVIMINYMIPWAFGIALTIRMGVTLPQSVNRARNIAVVSTVVTVAVFVLISLLLYIYSDWVFGIFTTEQAVMELAQTVWLKVCTFNVNCAVFGMMVGIVTGLGKQWALGVINFFYLWVVGVPLTYYYTLVKRGGLDAAWTWINLPYSAMNLTLVIFLFFGTDWRKIQKQICKGPEEDANIPTRMDARDTYPHARTNLSGSLLHDTSPTHGNHLNTSLHSFTHRINIETSSTSEQRIQTHFIAYQTGNASST